MSTAEFARKWFKEVWNNRRREAIDEMLAPNAVIHDAGDQVSGPKEFHEFFDRMQAAFSDVHVVVEDVIEEGDRACVRWSCSMKHTGNGLGIPASGKTLEVTGITIMREAGGRLVEGWQNWDMLGLMKQIEGKSGKAPTYIAAGM